MKSVLKLPGSHLTAPKRHFIYLQFHQRYTRENTPLWVLENAGYGVTWPVQFDSDLDWLEHTLFAATSNGALDRRYKDCWETPTWPDNPALRDQPRCVWAYWAINLRYTGWHEEYWTHCQRMKATLAVERLPEWLRRHNPNEV